MSLAQLSSEMRQARAFRRVYWSGAYYFLAMDVALRKRTDNAMGLDEALGRLAQCCALQSLSAAAIAQALDEVTGQSLFLPACATARNSRSFPEYLALFQELGIEVSNYTVALVEDVPLRKLRDSIGRQTYSGAVPASNQP